MTQPTPQDLRMTLVQAAVASIGHCYAYGGAPGRDGQGCWDCSSAVNWWAGVDTQLAIPGFPAGAYDGSVHGPSTLGWLDWQGQGVGSIDRSQVSGGDLCVWRTHMGLAISSDEMVSAQTPGTGTAKSGIDGFIQGEQLVCLRFAVIGPGGITLPPITIPGQADYTAFTRQQAQYARDVVWARMRILNVRRGGDRV